ncbi:alpha/beta fold hydrolase, partial [Legionella sp.]|uniref:alpha/beta fold hydrolase n=1 Tax=Legionella sp. TaxID=459 RepID=UPI003CAE7415
VWMPLVPQLKINYQLFLVDLPGFGQSSMMAWDIFKKQLLNQLPEQFVLLGWSMGGLYATRLALEEPERIIHLLNITSSPRFLLSTDWPGVSHEVFNTFYQNLLRDTRGTLKEFLKLHVRKNKLELALGGIPSFAGLESGLEILETWDFRQQLKKFKQPACYMFGRLDPIVPMSTMITMQEHYPTFEYFSFNRGAHMPFLSHMDIFINKIQGLIK